MMLDRHRSTRLLIGLLCVAFGAAQAPAADAVIPHAQDKPPGPPLSPEAARRKMSVPAGFRVQLVASEPDIVNPVAMTFDSRGRIWVTESLEYPRRSAGKGRDRIKILEDTDGDGKADTFKVFATGLNIPSGIAVGYGGVFVANAPDLLFLQDTDGDDVADRTEVLLTGFGRHDVHELPSALTWGPDGWLYGLNGVFNPSHIKHKGRDYRFTCALWRYHPVTKDFELFSEGTSNPWGLDYDHNGSFFISACVIDHLWHLVQTGYYHRQGGPYPPYTWKIGSIVKHRHFKAAYCGLMYYDADAYPDRYRRTLLMGNIHENALNHDTLERNGATYLAKPRNNFLNANDAWFMPVVQKVGPDGSIFVADWYDRYHCYQDANRDPKGIDRLKGRIWRIVYGDTKWPEPFDVAKLTDAQLVDTLGHANVWWRREAQRILVERNRASVKPALERLALGDHGDGPAARHAMWTRIGMGPLDPTFHLGLLRHADPIVRSWGVRAAAGMKRVSPPVRNAVTTLAADDSPDVRLQVAIAARRLEDVDAVGTLLAVMSHAQNDPLLPHILWQNLYPLLATDADRLTPWLAQAPLDDRPVARAMLGRIVDYLLTSKTRRVDAFAKLLAQSLSADPHAAGACLDALSRALMNDELSPAEQQTVRDATVPALRSIVTRDGALGATAAAVLARWNEPAGIQAAHAILADASKPWAQRRDVLGALAAVDGSTVLESVKTILTTQSSDEMQRDAIAALRQSRAPAVATMLVEAWPRLSDATKPLAADLLARRKPWATTLLAAIKSERVPRAALNNNQARQILGFDDPEVTALLTEVWGTFREGRDEQREELIRRMRRVVRRGKGDAVAGQQPFIKLCAQCHTLYEYGAEVGPDLTGVGRTDLDQILSNVLDPNLVIGAGYKPLLVLTTDGEILTGLAVENSDQRIVLKVNGGVTITIPRNQVEQSKFSETSLMPEDLEKGITEQEFRDLMALLLTKKRPAPWPDVKPVITPLQ